MEKLAVAPRFSIATSISNSQDHVQTEKLESSTPVEIVQAILKDSTNLEIVNPLVSPNAVYVSLFL